MNIRAESVCPKAWSQAFAKDDPILAWELERAARNLGSLSETENESKSAA